MYKERGRFDFEERGSSLLNDVKGSWREAARVCRNGDIDTGELTRMVREGIVYLLEAEGWENY